ncbi:cysteine hydrolase (plasmid) [Rhodococcus antarcticus]|jgi:ureidoacrylate peracid hydrolase|uniref:Cysteine hydrolase n=1 Tax=Rhodococcus antarcticus TaxID=2987751 RepID=A0ABY6P6L2_9NOCA|nr:cysteine hydrolase [Rhodococcus antarcticus]UZJ26921.1 cysteine hydrolase [Rhodococcus antarcticus]
MNYPLGDELAGPPASLSFRHDPRTTALVVVDVQNDFCDPAGVCAAAGNDVAAAVAMVPRLEHLLVAARAAKVLVVFVQTTHDDTTDSPAWVSRRSITAAATRAADSICRTGSWGAKLYRVSPEPGEPIVVKHRYSAFAGTNLDVVLRSSGITSLLLAGVSTDVCVESTLRDGLFHEYNVSLVEDCCASYHAGAHAATVSTVEQYFGEVTSSRHLANAWGPAVPIQ